MSEPKYGTMNKKVVFYDSDKRFAELKIRLQHDGISQAQFFRGIVTGYLMQDGDVLSYVDKLKASKNIGNRSKKSIKEERELINTGKEQLDKLALGDEEIENIFDILEKSPSSAVNFSTLFFLFSTRLGNEENEDIYKCDDVLVFRYLHI